MKKKALLPFVFLAGLSMLRAQDTIRYMPVKMQAVSASLRSPLGDFSDTHFGGMEIQYEWYGKNNANRSGQKQAFLFKANGGVAVYAGKKEKILTATYTYPLFTFVHAFGGLVWRPSARFQFSGTAGPALGIYNGNALFYVGAKVEGQYLISNRISAGPMIQLMKEKGSDPLWAGSLGIHYFF